MATIIKQHPSLGILVSSDGQIQVPKNGVHSEHWTTGYRNDNGYCRVVINRKPFLVHRLVAETFIPNPDNKLFVDHINRVRDDNRVENLRWVTRSENQRNTPGYDRVAERNGTHRCDDVSQYNKEHHKRYYSTVAQFKKEYNSIYRQENLERELDRGREYQKAKRLTHKRVRLSDGSCPWVPKDIASILLDMPVEERRYENPNRS